VKNETREQHRQIDEALHVPYESASGVASWVPRVIRVHEPYTVRSTRNILYWRSFLSEDCVLTMIKMGWDRTT
jgi:hypothetical protein